MSKIVLKINKEPPVKTYNHHTFGTGIITSIDKGINWIYNNYIQLSYYPKNGPLTFDFYMDYIYCQPVFDREYYSDEMMKMMKYNPIKLFKEALSQNKYVECCVNEYFIPKREAYLRYHFKHNILIYGFDDSKKAFFTLGYDEDGKYSEQMVEYKQIIKACPSNIHFLKFREELDYELDINRIGHLIKQYNGDEANEIVGSYPKDGQVIGMQAVNVLMDDICELIHNDAYIDIRPIHILMEQRRIMHRRLERLKELGKVEPEKVAKLKDYATSCEKLRNRVLMYNTRSCERDKEELLKLVKEQRNVKMVEIGL